MPEPHAPALAANGLNAGPPGEDLPTLYEIARALLGARDRAQVASRLVLSGMGALGAASGAMLVAEERGRYRLLYATGLPLDTRSETLVLPAPAREWMLREGHFTLASPGAARGLGEVRGELTQRFDAALGAAVSDAQGLAAVLLFGARVLPGDYGERERTLLDSLASLGAQALGGRPATDAAGSRPSARRPARSLAAMRSAHPALGALVGESPLLLDTCQDLVAVAPMRFPVLLTGESGVGKELAAHAIHQISERSGGPLEVVDCGSIPRELIESELFGHVRGAFTGAHRDRRGAFELAHRGTLFLDEIGEMPLPLQTRLLRALQEGRFRRVGDEHPIDVDVRVIAATNRDLRSEVAARRFREDLYYRLNVFAVRIPPLRERREDLEPLLRHFLDRQGREMGVRDWEVSPEVMDALASYEWPGNVRELGNVVAGLTVRARHSGAIAIDDLDHVWRRQNPGAEPPWHGRAGAPRGRIGDWVLAQARASRFNLIEAARLLARLKRVGQRVPLTERSALSYYLTGEILRALADSDGDSDRAARLIAGDDDLLARAVPRVRKVCDALRDVRGGVAGLRRRFAKLPAGYEDALERAHALVPGARGGVVARRGE